jgi:hypothetical protein
MDTGFSAMRTRELELNEARRLQTQVPGESGNCAHVQVGGGQGDRCDYRLDAVGAEMRCGDRPEFLLEPPALQRQITFGCVHITGRGQQPAVVQN